MLEELRRFLGADASRVTIVDVDRYEDLRRRYGHKVPVLLLDGELVCYGRFDHAEVVRLTRSAPRGS
jgi:predicted thioredoxin/glutaredoxin